MPDIPHSDLPQKKQLAKDVKLDDLSIAIRTENGLLVVTVCTHAAIINIIIKSIDLSGYEKVDSVIG